MLLYQSIGFPTGYYAPSNQSRREGTRIPQRRISFPPIDTMWSFPVLTLCLRGDTL
jgi:hypothetical protein